jgi:hypothetical protein
LSVDTCGQNHEDKQGKHALAKWSQNTLHG